MSKQKPVLAVDLGGTKILTAVIGIGGRILARKYCLTRADEGLGVVVQRILSALDSVLKEAGMDLSQVGGISLAAAGAIDATRGVITVSPNLPGWNDVPLRDIIKEKLKTDTWLINDAKAAALGEYHFGAGRGTRNLIYLTVSTGIGGGIITNGELYFGHRGSAGEIGHMTIDTNGPPCACGNVGCLEVMASGTAVAKDALERLNRGEKSMLREIVSGDLAQVTAKEVAGAAAKGDGLALEVITRAATYLGVGLVNLVNTLNPEIIVIGGGMSKMGALLFDPAKRVVAERALPLAVESVRIVPADRPDDAGLLGAAVFATHQET